MSVGIKAEGAAYSSGNLLLGRLSAQDRAFILARSERVALTFGQDLTAPDQSIAAAYFPENGVISVVKPDGPGERVEICLFGREGFSGAALVTGDGRWPYRTFVQVPELTAVRISAEHLGQCMEHSPGLRVLLIRAVHVMMIQIAENAVSASWQTLNARLARWLLMYRDRLGGDRIEVTHDFIARMIGAQRTGVTSALHELEGSGAVRTSRGTIVIRDAGLLRERVDGSYGVAEREARRMLE